MIEAELADGRILEFPDGTDPLVIQSSVKNILKEVVQENTNSPASFEPEKKEVTEDAIIESDQGFAGGAANSLLSGSTLGFSNELQAGIAAGTAKLIDALSDNPAVSDKTFRQLMAEANSSLKADQEKFAKENPGTDLALNVIGGLATGGAVAGAAKTGVKELAKQGAKLGTVAGTGFSDSEEFFSVDTVEDALVGATGGAVLSVLTPTVIKGIAKAGKAIPQSIPEKLLETALKFRPSIDNAARSRMTKTALKEGILPTVSGLKRITDKLGSLDTKINTIIDDATDKGVSIPKNALFKELSQLRRKLGGAKLESGNDLRQINTVVKSFNEQLKKINKTKLTPREAQDLKTDAYKRINFDLSQGKANFAKNEAKGSIARAAKNELEKIDPDVKTTNQRLGNLIELKGEMERVVSRLDNRNLISLDTAAKIGAGAATNTATGTAAGTTASVLGAPRVKARIALGLENIRKTSEIISNAETKLSPELAEVIAVLVGKTQDGLRAEIDSLED